MTCTCGCTTGAPIAIVTTTIAAPTTGTTTIATTSIASTSPVAPFDGASTVTQVLARHPGSAAVFRTVGIDTCCGGVATLTDAAHAAGTSLASLLDALAIRARGDLVAAAGVA